MAISKVSGTAWADVAKVDGISAASIAGVAGVDAPAGTPSVVTDNLFLEWLPTAVSGTQVTDQSGNGHHGTMYNGASVTTTPTGETAFYTDGVNDHITAQISQSALSGVAYPITYEAWTYVKLSSATNSFSHFIHNDPADTVDWHRLFMRNVTGGQYLWAQKYAYAGQQFVAYQNSAQTMTDETWLHLVMTLTLNGSNNVVSLYVNGSFVGSAEDTYNNIYNIVPWSEGTGDTNFSIGSLQRTGPSYYNGYVGDVRFYSDLLSASEIAQNYNATKSNYGH